MLIKCDNSVNNGKSFACNMVIVCKNDICLKRILKNKLNVVNKAQILAAYGNEKSI